MGEVLSMVQVLVLQMVLTVFRAVQQAVAISPGLSLLRGKVLVKGARCSIPTTYS